MGQPFELSFKFQKFKDLTLKLNPVKDVFITTNNTLTSTQNCYTGRKSYPLPLTHFKYLQWNWFKGSVLFHVMKQVWNISFAVTLVLPPWPPSKVFFLDVFFQYADFENLLQSSAYHSQKISRGLKFTSTLLNMQLFVLKGPTVLDNKSSRPWKVRLCPYVCITFECISSTDVILLQHQHYKKGHFCSSVKKKVLRKSFKLVLALFPNPVFHFVLQFLTTLPKSPQIFEETGISCYFIKVYKLSAWFLTYPLPFWFSDFY